MRTTTLIRLGAVAAIAALALGCAAKKMGGATFHEQAMDFSLVHTVAVLPLSNLSPTQTADDRVRDVFMTMLQAQGGGIYVVPLGEVQRALTRVEMPNPAEPSAQNIVELGKILNADAIVTGTVLEYGEGRSGSASGNYVSLSAQMLECKTGKLVWSAQTTKGGVSTADRMFGGGGQPMNVVTAEAVNDLLDSLFKVHHF